MKKSRKKTIVVAVIAFFVIAIIYGAIYLKNFEEYKLAVSETSFDGIEISNVSDGVYIGEYDVNFIYAKVEVTVKNGEITNINILEHKNERGKSAEAIVDKIIEEQKIEVDAISNATNSSTVLKKAVENALKNGR